MNSIEKEQYQNVKVVVAPALVINILLQNLNDVNIAKASLNFNTKSYAVEMDIKSGKPMLKLPEHSII